MMLMLIISTHAKISENLFYNRRKLDTRTLNKKNVCNIGKHVTNASSLSLRLDAEES